MAWPLVLLLAWFLGERLHQALQVPRVSSYVGVGLIASLVNLPGLTAEVPGLPFLANIALSLLLFELGYRINLRWFRHNPWVLALGLVESLLTFALVYVAAGWFGLATDVRLIIAALSISASPAGIVRVANELRSAGQVTERVMHLCAINCLMSVLALKLLVGYWTLSTSGDLMAAALGSVYALLTSIAMGTLAGVIVPWLLRRPGTHERGVTVVFALAVVLLTTMSYGLRAVAAAGRAGVRHRGARAPGAPHQRAARLWHRRRPAHPVSLCLHRLAARLGARWPAACCSAWC